MNRSSILRAFISGKTSGKASSITLDQHVLWSYDTQIAYREDDGSVLVNQRKYSPTTSRQQSSLRLALHDAGFTETQEVVERPARYYVRWSSDGGPRTALFRRYVRNMA